MIVTWESFCKRRRISLSDLVQGHGMDYDKLCVFFKARGSTFPDRLDPEVVKVLGFPEPSPTKKDPVPTPAPVEHVVSKPKPEKRIEVSIKNTKAELLDVALRLNLDASDKLTKAKILEALSTSSKVLVKQVSTGRRKASSKKKK